LEHLLDALHPPDYYQRFRCGRGHRDRALPYSKPDQLGEVHVEDGDPGLFSCRRNLRDGAVGEDHGRDRRGDIYYTTNGSTPTTSSTKYSGAIKVSTTETLKAIAVAAGYANSSVGTARYTLKTATPVLSPAGGTYATAQSVKITDVTAGATIYYTTNGSTPTISSTKYSGAIKVSTTETLKAIAVTAGHANSSVGTATYTLKTATPVLSPAGGTYATAQSVKITDATGRPSTTPPTAARRRARSRFRLRRR